MASADSEAEAREAQRRGWRTFRSRAAGAPLLEDEIPCVHEEHPEVQCAQCSLCRGANRPAKSIAITVHGNGAKWYGQRRLLEGGQPRVTADWEAEKR